MNKKTILNRTLPLIVALLVILVVAICVTVFTGNEKKPMVENKDEAYLTIDLGYDKPIKISKGEVYLKLLNGGNGLSYLVDILDKELLTSKGYMAKVTEDEIKEAVEEAIFGKDYEFDAENLDADNKKIEEFKKQMYLSYGMQIQDASLEIKDGALVVSLSSEAALSDYYKLSLARKKYTRDQMGEDQVKSYEEFIKAYEEYLVELYKFENDEITAAPSQPTDSSVITSSAVETDYNNEFKDSYWTLFVQYATKAEAEQALLQVGVVIQKSKWYEYEGIIDLEDPANFDENGKKFTSLAEYYKGKGTELTLADIHLKLIELYNNAKGDEVLKSETHYTVETLTKAQYDALDDKLKDEKYSEIKGADGAESTYKAVLFKTVAKKDAEGKLDAEATENELYYDGEKLAKVDSSVASYIKSLIPLYSDGSSKKLSDTYTTSIVSKGSYYVLGAKFVTEEATDFDEVYKPFLDEEKYEDGVSKEGLADLQIGRVPYTRDEKGNLTFNYEGNKYWEKVLELLDDAVTTAKINEYMAKLRYESELTILDKDIESQYVTTYTSDYEVSKKSSKDVVAKIEIDGKEFVVKASDLYAALESHLGGITATDAYQYHNVLSQSDVIDYEKYLGGADLEDCVYITEYALAKKGTQTAVTKWLKADHDGLVEFEKVDGTVEYDVLVRTATKGEKKVVELFDAHDVEVEDETSKKTTIIVTVEETAHFHDAETTFDELDDQIASLKLYFTNGGFVDYGFDASYGWKNFLKDYFASYYGITVESNEDLKLYYIYEDAVSHISEELAVLAQENGTVTEEGQNIWNSYYLPYMLKQYNDYFSVDAIHFLISVNDAEGNISDPNAEDTAWTAEQKEAAEELYGLVYEILRRTKSTAQKQVLNDIVSAFDAAPKFIVGVEQTTEAQQKYFDENSKYVEKNEDGYTIDQAIKYTAEFKGITLEVSKYKTLGLTVKTEDLGTVTAGKMVEPFEDALRLMWQYKQMTDPGMKEGTSLESNTFYDEYAEEGYLITEFGYHVLIANKFTGHTTAQKEVKNENGKTEKVNTIVTLPSLSDVLIYERNDEEYDDLSAYTKKQVETYYSKVAADFSASYWYQLNVMQDLLAELNSGSKLTFANASAKEHAIKTAEFYVETYYGNLTYISEGYDYAMDLMEIFVDAYNVKAFAMENAADDYAEKYVATEAELNTLLAVAEKALEGSFEMDATETKAFEELKAEFEAAKKAWQAK